jgi:hypothetical protein
MDDGSTRTHTRRPAPVVALMPAAAGLPVAPPTDVGRPPPARVHYLDWLRVLALLGSSATTRSTRSKRSTGTSRTPNRAS